MTTGATAGIGHPAELERIHIVGIGGAGMSAIATVLAAMGHRVTGSDLRESAVTGRLRDLGIDVAIGHRAEHVAGADLVTYSTAVAEANPERADAVRRGIPVASRSDVLAAVAGLRRTIAVAGTHGKTTTSSMLALILVEAGLHPSFLIGGEVNEIGTNAVWDEGAWIVVEADESDGTFLDLRPEIAVVTNIEADHLDHFGTFAAVRAAFARFLDGVAGARVVCGDDPEAAALGAAAGAVPVGTGVTAGPAGPGAAWRIDEVELGRSSASFTLTGPGAPDGLAVRLAVPGLHNVRNASVAAVAALAAGAPPPAVVAALGRFGGVARRFEFRGAENGITFVDDYAHLPTEVRATLAAAAGGGWGRVVAVFQPHRYSRIAEVGEEFGGSFGEADVVVVTDVYGAGEAPIPGISGRTVADAVARSLGPERVRYVPGRAELAGELAGLLAPGDLCLSLGAGDLTALPDEVLDLLRAPDVR